MIFQIVHIYLRITNSSCVKERDFYERNLPHVQPLGGTFFVTFHLHGSIPQAVLQLWKEELIAAKAQLSQVSSDFQNDLEILWKKDFLKRDKYLDTLQTGTFYLKDERIAKVVADSFHFWDNKLLELYAYCIMPNHVHVVFRLFDETETEKPVYLEKIMHSIKLYSANECNKLLDRSGAFWQHESYDRLVRDDQELRRIMTYVLDNPVKAGLCSKMADWKWSYIKKEYDDIM